MASIILIELKPNINNKKINDFFSNINDYISNQNFTIINSTNNIIYFNKLNVPPTKLKSYTTFIKNTTGYHSIINKIFIGSNLHFI